MEFLVSSLWPLCVWRTRSSAEPQLTGSFCRIMSLIYRYWQNTSGRVSPFFKTGRFFEVLCMKIINTHKAACVESRRPGVFECVWMHATGFMSLWWVCLYESVCVTINVWSLFKMHCWNHSVAEWRKLLSRLFDLYFNEWMNKNISKLIRYRQGSWKAQNSSLSKN